MTGATDPFDLTAHLPQAPGGGAAGGAPQLSYASVADWVEQYLALVYARPIDYDQFYWCRRWWVHDEALDRLEALWRAWEACRVDAATGPATWWKDYADPIMGVLLSAAGPFKACSNGHHARPDLLRPPLPVDPAPAVLFPSGH